MTIDPRWSIFLSLFLAVLGFLSGAGASFSDLGMDPVHVKALLALIAIFLGVGNAVNAVLTGIPSKDDTTGFIFPLKARPPEEKS